MLLYLKPSMLRHPVTVAYQDWLSYAIDVGGLRTVTYAANEIMHRSPSTMDVLRDLPSVGNNKEAELLIKASDTERESDFKRFHALWLVGMWGTYESFIEDICKAVIVTKPEILQTRDFANISLPVKDLYAGENNLANHIYKQLRQAMSSAGSDEDGGIKYFELLRAVGLEADPPRSMRKVLHEARHVRNLWAHKAGKADAYFIKVCKSVDVQEGEVVAIDRRRAERYALAMVGYSHILFNRFLEGEGLKPLTLSGMGEFQEDFDNLFPNSVKSHWVRRKA